jgi:hypothetical protein
VLGYLAWIDPIGVILFRFATEKSDQREAKKADDEIHILAQR